MLLPASLPELPVEVWEYVIDIIADFSFESERYPLNYGARMDLTSCYLVCRAWGPRCRLYLFREIDIVSRDSLRLLSAFLRNSPFHAGLVRTLNIRGGDAEQSWVPSVPLLLPKLYNLRELSFDCVDFRRQHPRFSQLYSLFRNRGGSDDDEDVGLSLTLAITPDTMTDTPGQIASLAAVLDAQIFISDSNDSTWCHSVQTSFDVMTLNSWTRRLASYIDFKTEGTVQDLLQILPGWRYPVEKWDITILGSTFEEQPRETWKVWREIARVALMGSGDVRFQIDVQMGPKGDQGYLNLRLDAGTPISLSCFNHTEPLTRTLEL